MGEACAVAGHGRVVEARSGEPALVVVPYRLGVAAGRVVMDQPGERCHRLSSTFFKLHQSSASDRVALAPCCAVSASKKPEALLVPVQLKALWIGVWKELN